MEREALAATLPPIILTLVFVLASWRPWTRTGRPGGAWGSALGIASGFATSVFLLRGWQGFRPASGLDWLSHIAIVVGLLVAILSARKKIGARLPVSVLLTAGACAAVLKVPLYGDWRRTLPVLGIAIATGLVMWACIQAAAHGSKGARLPLILWGAAVGSAIVLLQSGNAMLAPLAGSLAASMGVFVVLGWVRPQIQAVAGALPVYILVMLGLFIAGRGFAKPWERTDVSFIFAAASVASPVLTTLPPIRNMRPWMGTLLGLILALALAAAGVALSLHRFDFSGLS